MIHIIEKQPATSNIKKIYQSFLQIQTNPDKIIKKTHGYLFESLYKMNELLQPSYNTKTGKKNNPHVMQLIGWLNKHGFSAPILLHVTADIKNPTQYLLEIYNSGITFVNIGFYASPAHKKIYLEYLHTLFATLLGPTHTFNVEDIYNIEKTIVHYAMSLSDYYNPEKSYHKIHPHEFSKYGFTKHDIVQYIGYPASSIQRGILIDDPYYVKSVLRLMQHKQIWSSPSWKSYWTYQILKFYSKYNNYLIQVKETFSQHFYNLRHTSPEKKALLSSITIQSVELNRLYLKQMHREKEKQFCRMLFVTLKNRLRTRLLNNTWLHSQTVKKAVLKIDKMEIRFGSHKNPRMASKYYEYKEPTHTDVEYIEDDPVHNIHCFLNWNYNESIRSIGKHPPPRTILTEGPGELHAFEVNAFYVKTCNMIFIPDAILTHPFLNLHKSFTYNLAHIGMILAHEISHALDNNGSQYNEKGEIEDWWTSNDKKTYQKKLDRVKQQYTVFAQRDRLNIRSLLNLGENMADITGFLLAEDVLHQHLIERNIVGDAQKNHFKELYIQYAKQWRSTLKIKKLRHTINNDVHSAAKYRVNCVLSRSALFHTLFNIEKGDGMYYETDDIIW